jgi:hypothetical protein
LIPGSSLADVRNKVELAEERKTASDWEQPVLAAGFTCPVLERARVGRSDPSEARG